MDLQSGYPFWHIRNHDATPRHCDYQAWSKGAGALLTHINIFTIDDA